MSGYDAIVLAGGAGTRLGGVAKACIELNGVSMLDRVLQAVATAHHRIVVGPPVPTTIAAQWCREVPAGGGPVAGCAAGLALSTADTVLLLAVDLPCIGPAIPKLIDKLATSEHAAAAALIDTTGRVNYLAAAWRRVELSATIQSLGGSSDKSMRPLYSGREIVLVPDCDGWGQDCDTPADLTLLRKHFADLPEWDEQNGSSERD